MSSIKNLDNDVNETLRLQALYASGTLNQHYQNDDNFSSDNLIKSSVTNVFAQSNKRRSSVDQELISNINKGPLEMPRTYTYYNEMNQKKSQSEFSHITKNKT